MRNCEEADAAQTLLQEVARHGEASVESIDGDGRAADAKHVDLDEHDREFAGKDHAAVVGHDPAG